MGYQGLRGVRSYANVMSVVRDGEKVMGMAKKFVMNTNRFGREGGKRRNRRSLTFSAMSR